MQHSVRQQVVGTTLNNSVKINKLAVNDKKLLRTCQEVGNKHCQYILFASCRNYIHSLCAYFYLDNPYTFLRLVSCGCY